MCCTTPQERVARISVDGKADSQWHWMACARNQVETAPHTHTHTHTPPCHPGGNREGEAAAAAGSTFAFVRRRIFEMVVCVEGGGVTVRQSGL